MQRELLNRSAQLMPGAGGLLLPQCEEPSQSIRDPPPAFPTHQAPRDTMMASQQLLPVTRGPVALHICCDGKSEAAQAPHRYPATNV